MTIYVNEEGLIRWLSINPRAALLWCFHVQAARQEALLVGDAVIVGMPDRRDDSTDVPEAASELTAPGQRWRVEYLAQSDVRWRQGDVGRDEVWEAMA